MNRKWGAINRNKKSRISSENLIDSFTHSLNLNIVLNDEFYVFFNTYVKRYLQCERFFFYLKNTVRLVLNFLHRLTNRGLNVPKLFCNFKQTKVLIFKNTDIRSLIANMHFLKLSF